MLLRKLSFIGIFILSTILFASLSEGKNCGKAKTYFQKARKLGVTASNLIKKEQLYRKAIELCPSFAEAHNNLGDVYEKQGRFEEAIVEYKKTIELYPDAPYPYFGLGDIYYKTGRYQEAIEWYEKGLKHDPDDKLTGKIMPMIKDIQEKGVVKAETIRGMLSIPLPGTRGAGEVVSLTFGEGLIPFDYDKSNIRSDAKVQLNEIGKALKGILTSSKDISVVGIETSIIEIAGHTDNRGPDEYNLLLSRNRAESVVSYLVKNFNISRERLKPVGYGERRSICTTGDTEACHALNRRVEIVKGSSGKRGTTRGVSNSQDLFESKELIIDLGFFYQRKGEKLVEVLKEDSRLRSKSDKYFIFLRPLQDSYVYILQEDSTGNIDLIFPKKGKNAYVKKGQDYWVPGFGRAYTLDETRGKEKLYLLATSWSLESAIEGLSLKEQVRGAVKSLETRIIKVVRPSNAPENVSSEELNKKPLKINDLLERVEGEGGWVKVVRFRHE